LLAPILDEGAERHLGQPAPCAILPVFPEELDRSRDAPLKAVCSAGSGIADDAARLAFRVDEQLGARADAGATPLALK